MIPNQYDPLTLHHWLCWSHLCGVATPDEFQRLFEEVMARVKPGFMPIRPYGKYGDRKSDGWLESEGTVYQVYSPDECRQAETQKKIQEDLTGAVEVWRERGMTRWVFVYNARRGVPPDISATLNEEREKYPDIAIDHLGNQDLWELIRALPLQKRVEILGPPPGFEYLFLAGETDSEEARERLRCGRFVLIHDLLTPIDLHLAPEALTPDLPLGPPLRVRPNLRPGEWQEAAEQQQELVLDALTKSEQLRPRFAIFGLSPIPLLVHLGYVISDRVEVELFQYDRDRKSWAWDPAVANGGDSAIEVLGIPETPTAQPIDVVMRVSLSARIPPSDTAAVVSGETAQVDLTVPDPSVMWLRSPSQLRQLGRTVRETLQLLGERIPNCSRIHLFYAGPAGGAVVLGQAFNPRMNPPLALYEYHRQRSPRYERAIVLAE